MAWIVGYVGGDEHSEIRFENKEAATKEYYLRLEKYKRNKGRFRNKDPPGWVNEPLISCTGDDAFYLMRGYVQKVIKRKGYSVVSIGEQMRDGPLHYYWHDCQPSLKPGDRILFNHETDPYTKKEGLFALRIYG